MATYVSNIDKWENLHQKSANKFTRIQPNDTIKKILSLKNKVRTYSDYTRTLEIGCGFGRNLSYLINHKFSSYYSGIDLTKVAIQKSSETLSTAVKNGIVDLKLGNVGHQINYPDNYFDYVFDIMSAITFIVDEKERKRYFSEITRVLKPGGAYFFLAARKEGKFMDAYPDEALLEEGYIRRKIDSMLERVYTSEELATLLSPLKKIHLEISSEHTRAFGDEKFIRDEGFWFGYFKK